MIAGETSLQIMADEWALLRLSWLYARAMDRNEPDTLAAIFTADAKLEGDWFKVEGIEQIKQLPTGLSKRYARMMHTVHNQTVDIADDRAEGETYCLAADRRFLTWAYVIGAAGSVSMDRGVLRTARSRWTGPKSGRPGALWPEAVYHRGLPWISCLTFRAGRHSSPAAPGISAAPSRIFLSGAA
jgi:hypothetical protein